MHADLPCNEVLWFSSENYIVVNAHNLPLTSHFCTFSSVFDTLNPRSLWEVSFTLWKVSCVIILKMKKWSLQWTNLCNCVKMPEKNSGLQQGLNPWPCYIGAMLYKLSYEATDVGSRSIMGSYVPVKEMSVNDIWNKSYMNCGNEMKKMIVLLNTKKTEKKTKGKFDLQQIFMLGRCLSSPKKLIMCCQSY